MSLPRPIEPMVQFAQLLRGAGFAVAPEQTVGFIEAVGVLGPDEVLDIQRAGRALFAIPPERMAEYDALFRAVFMGQTVSAAAQSSEDDEVGAYEPTGETAEVEVGDEDTEIGAEATLAERLGRRALSESGEAEILAHFARAAPASLPRRISYRRQAVARGDRIDMRRVLREAARRDGDVIRLYETARKTRQRRLVLLVDVSGSMSERSEASMRLAHAVVQAAERAEVFSFGTRLTRLTAALRPADRNLALARASEAVADFDGGTRIGEALQAFLAVPRYAGFARGAAVVVLSDGLERGAPDTMVDAVSRLRRLAWRLDWLTPLAADPSYQPETAALKAVQPMLDSLGDGSGTADVISHILNLARAA